jgi:hypothetical protein
MQILNRTTLLLAAVIGLLPFSNAQSPVLPPLSDFVGFSKSQKPDSTEIAYFANRGAILLRMVGECFKENAADDESKARVDRTFKMAEEMSFVGIFLDLNKNGKDKEFIKEQRDVFLKYYIEK